MFTHVMVGCNDKGASLAFYDATFGTLGIEGMRHDRGAFYRSEDGSMFGVVSPANGEAATYANGGTIGLAATSKDQVDAWHAAGLANGGTDEGAPGPRDYTDAPMYGAYLRDPCGNKLCLYVFGEAAA